MRRFLGLAAYNQFMGCFEALPIAAVLTTFYGRFLCVHGGISEDIQTLKDIEDINRFVEPPMSGPLCDVLWADPMRDAVMVDYCSGKYFKRRRACIAYMEAL